MAADLALLHDGPSDSPLHVILAHGAGAAMDSPFLTHFAQGLSTAGFAVSRFEFPYMAARRSGARRPPDRHPVLVRTWEAAVAAIRERHPGRPVILAGKSLGGRIASHVADDVEARGLVVLGYPFHPPGGVPTGRIEHLATLRTPTLVVQGTRDPFGRREEVAEYAISPAIRVHWIEDGDHSLAVRARSGRNTAAALGEAVAAVVTFLESRR